jgi:KDO2-lipid IV(A) lauroyltransferase
MSSLFKRFRYSVGIIVLDILAFIIPHIPVPVLYTGLDVIWTFFSPLQWLFPEVRKNLTANFNIVFGDSLSKRERRGIARRAVRNLLNVPVISVYYAHPENLPQLLNNVTFVGLDHLRQALEKKSGVIALGAHIGNFILLDIALAQTDLPFTTVTKDPHNKDLKLRYDRWKRACGLTWIDADRGPAATRQILRALKDNLIVQLISDERKKHDGIIVPFFGRPALTAAGPAVLSLRTGSPIVPIFIYEHARYKHTIEISAPLEVERTGDTHKDIHLLTEKANRAIADMIRSHPDQWTWTNPRWKL